MFPSSRSSSFFPSQKLFNSTGISFTETAEHHPIWTDSLILPGYFACVSILYIAVNLICSTKCANNKISSLFCIKHVMDGEVAPQTDSSPMARLWRNRLRQHALSLGGETIYIFRVTRFISCLVLLVLSIMTLVSETGGLLLHFEHPGKYEGETNNPGLHVAMTLVYVYASVLALMAVCARPKVANAVNTHLVLLMLVVWATYAYRDLYPFATFELISRDVSEGWILWTKVGVLSFTAIVIPLSVPCQYIPFDPKNPSVEINTEQTASLFSWLFYFFMDPLILKASRTAHLPASEFPPIADYDLAKNLRIRAFEHLDPMSGKKRRHLFWGFVRIFRREWITISFILVAQSFISMVKVAAINRLLTYLEEDGRNAYVRPWVWVFGIFFAPFAASIFWQWHNFLSCRCVVRTEAIITQLVFEHSLRIRMKAETFATPCSEPITAATPETASVGDQSSSAAQEIDETAASATLTGESISETQKKHSQKSELPVKSANLIGKINNLVTSDQTNIVKAYGFLLLAIEAPLKIGVSICFLYAILGWSAIVGSTVLVILLPAPGYVAKLMQTVQKQKMTLTDARVGSVTEIMSVVRMIKLFGWESKMQEKISKKRSEELKLQRERLFLELLNSTINFQIPVIVMIVTFSCYTLIMKQDLTASRVFSAMAALDILKDEMFMVFRTIPDCIQVKVSLDRVGEFLHETELLDEFASDGQGITIADNVDANHDLIGFRNSAFTWANEAQLPTTPGSSRRNFTLRVEEELIFKKGKFNVIYGPTGSGKTSLLMALLGELHFIPSGPDSWFNLPREGGVAYAAQESWVQNETIKDNILFGSSYDEARYNQVIYQCGLVRDLSLFKAGDNTEVGEKGLSLSGGQKARLTLARAIYSPAEILILDDVLAALDVHTAQWVVKKCFQGDLVKGRTVILVTHNVAMTSPIADFAVSLGSDGRLLSQGTISTVLKIDKLLSAQVESEKKEAEMTEEVTDIIKPDDLVKQGAGKLILTEEISEGHVTWAALKLLFVSMGGTNFATFWVAVVGMLTLTELLTIGGTWFLSYWSAQYDRALDKPVPVAGYMGVYSFILISTSLVYAIATWIFIFGSMRASLDIHRQLIQAVLGTTLRWLDSTPVSRFISRCTQDIQAVDGSVTRGLSVVLKQTLVIMTRFGAVVVFTPLFALPGIAVAFLGFWCGQVYIKTQLCVKREMSNARSPVLGHFGAAISGTVSIRAYQAQDAFRKESLVRIDRYTRSARTFYNLNRWIGLRVDTLGALFTTALAAYFVYRPRSGNEEGYAAKTGFSLNMAVGFSSMILWWVRNVNDFEVSANSLERIQQYITIEQEEKPVPEGVPPAYWPASGDVRVEGLSASYTPGGPKVLHEVSFHIASGERVGVVGRTGSSKSTLTLALLRFITTSGSVYFDNLDTSKINLDALRSSVTIIPQIPELLSGTLRENLDPLDQHDDVTLNDALRSAGLFSVQNEADEGRITLESAISSGGGNLSVGQRQILALARAMVRRSKLLILDEATSAIDYATDTVIQNSLRHGLDNDVTVLTVAHRLQTIMDADKIMVLDAGRVVEFGKPNELLRISGGWLRGLVDESGDKDNLYHMARSSV